MRKKAAKARRSKALQNADLILKSWLGDVCAVMKNDDDG
jgi:hypothetical protein